MSDQAVAEPTTEAVYRIEEPLEDVLKKALPLVPRTMMKVQFLWSSKSGDSSFYRVNYWNLNGPFGNAIVQASRFVRVTGQGDESIISDLTIEG